MSNLSLLALSIALSSVAIAFIVLSISYYRLIVRLRRQQKENDFLKYDAKEKAAMLLDSARDRGLQILAEANQKAKEILQSAHSFSSNADEVLQKSVDEVADRESHALTQVSQDLLATYQKGIDEIKNDSINVFRNASKDVESRVLAEIQEYVGLLQKQTVGSQKIVDDKLQEAAMHIQAELEAYKADKMKKFDERFYQALEIAIKDVLGKSLRMDEHQELVVEALTAAKADMQKIVVL